MSAPITPQDHIELLWKAIRGLQEQINELIELTNQLRPQ